MKIRRYKDSDFEEVCKIGYDTYLEFCFREGTKKATKEYLDRFLKMDDSMKENFSNSPFFYVVEIDSKIVGYIKGNLKKVSNLYVLGKYQGKGIDRKLYEKFEREFALCGGNVLRIRASLYAVPFYEKMGFKKSTGIRRLRGLKFQPMKKVVC